MSVGIGVQLERGPQGEDEAPVAAPSKPVSRDVNLPYTGSVQDQARKKAFSGPDPVLAKYARAHTRKATRSIAKGRR